MKNSKLYLVLLMVSATLFLYSCDSVTDSAQVNDIQSQALTTDSNARKAKVDVCHYDAELDAYELINIASPALQAHLNHGDGVPGGEVPDKEGFEFDETCTPEPVVEITECFAIVKGNFLTPDFDLADVVFEDLVWSRETDDGNIFEIDSPFKDGTLTLKTGPNSNQCAVLYNDGITTGISGVALEDSDIEENRSYLEYLLSL